MRVGVTVNGSMNLVLVIGKVQKVRGRAVAVCSCLSTDGFFISSSRINSGKVQAVSAGLQDLFSFTFRLSKKVNGLVCRRIKCCFSVLIYKDIQLHM